VSGPSDIEKENLEAHVELCAIRYKELESRLENIEKKVSSLADAIKDSHLSTIKVLIGTAGTVVASVLGLVIVMVQKL
jgi:tetrahydromethanopterin S-methyltransferase subunit G